MSTPRTTLRFVALTLAFAACGGTTVEETFTSIGESLDDGGSVASCETLPADELAVLTDEWTGSGTLTVTAAERAPTTGTDMFTHVVFVEGSAPGVDSEVFVFAVEGADLTNPDGFLVGADSVTREFFTWGAAATAGSPMADEARAAVDGAPACLP